MITGLKMNRIGEKNMISTTCNKKQATTLDAMNINNNDVCDIIEDVHGKDKFGKEFDIVLIPECEYDEDFSENEEGSSGESNNKDGDELWQSLLELLFYYMSMIQK